MAGEPERQLPGERGRVLTDEEAARLWGKFLAGSDANANAAFEKLYDRFLSLVIRFCRFRLGDMHAAEDAADAVFVRLLETRPTVKSSFIGLLLGTARNVCATEPPRRHPSSAATPAPPARDRLADGPAVEDDQANEIERLDVSTALADCIARLPERDRTLVALRYGEDLTYRQIRDVLGERVALSSLSRQLEAIKARLRRCLKEKSIFDAKTGG